MAWLSSGHGDERFALPCRVSPPCYCEKAGASSLGSEAHIEVLASDELPGTGEWWSVLDAIDQLGRASLRLRGRSTYCGSCARRAKQARYLDRGPRLTRNSTGRLTCSLSGSGTTSGSSPGPLATHAISSRHNMEFPQRPGASLAPVGQVVSTGRRSSTAARGKFPIPQAIERLPSHVLH